MKGGLFLDLNLFQNLKKDIESNTTIKKFIDELSNFLKDTTSSVKPNSSNINNENLPNTKENLFDKENTLDVKEYRKEGHLYFVTEDRSLSIPRSTLPAAVLLFSFLH